MANRLPPKKTVRCKWFDDDKEPIKGGCKNPSTCDFTHPGDSEWGYASRRQTATERPPNPRHRLERAPTPPALKSRKEEMSRQKDSSGSYNSNWRGDRRDDRRKETTDFNESSWDVPSTSSKGKAPERTSTWGASSSSGWGSPPKKSGSFDAGSSIDKGAWASTGGWSASSGWGDSEASGGQWGTASGWGVSDNLGPKEKDTGGWGSVDTGSGSKPTGGGWNATDSGSSSKLVSGGWDTGSVSGGWGSSSEWTSTAGWGSNSTSTADSSTPETSKLSEPRGKTASVAPHPARKPSLTIQFGHSRQSSTDDSLPTPDARKTVSFVIPPLPDRALAENKGKERAVAHPSERSRDLRRAGASGSNSNTPLMGPPPVSAASSKMPPTSSSTHTGSTSKELLSQAKAIKRRAAVPEDMKPKISILQAKLTAEERAEVYQKTIRYIQELVCVQIKLNKMKTAEQNWKRNQSSNFYGNSSQLAREKLTAGREDVAKGMVELRKERDTVIKDLVSLPDIPTKPYRPYNPMADRQKLVDYTLELKTWMEELDIPKRVAALQIKEVQTPKSLKESERPLSSAAAGPTETTSDTMVVDSAEAEANPSIAEQLRILPRVTVADINSAIETLQNSVALAWDKVLFEAYTQEEIDDAVDDIRRQVTEMLKERRLKTLNSQKLKIQAAMDEQGKARDELSKALDQKLILGEAVNERINVVQGNVDEIKRKTAELNRLNDELEPLVVAAERRQGRKTESIENMTNQLQALMARRVHAKPRKVREYNIDDVPLEFRQTIVNEVVAEVQPVLEGLLAGTSRAGEELAAALEQVIEPLLEKTATITKVVKSLPTASSS